MDGRGCRKKNKNIGEKLHPQWMKGCIGSVHTNWPCNDTPTPPHNPVLISAMLDFGLNRALEMLLYPELNNYFGGCVIVTHDGLNYESKIQVVIN